MLCFSLKRIKAFLSVAVACGAMPFVAFAQAGDPGVVDRARPEVEIPEKLQLRTPEKAPLQEEPALSEEEAAEEIVAHIKAITFKGNKKISTELLDQVVAGYLERPFTKGDLEQLKFDVSSYYYRQGYILVRVVVPPQNLGDGVLEVVIVEAHIGGVQINNADQALHPAIVQGMVDGRIDLEEKEIFDEAAVESLVNDIDDLPNLDAFVVLKRGKEFGATDIMLDVKQAEEEEDIQSLTFDNYGSPLTGEHVLTGHVEKSNFLGLGETIFADARRSETELWSVAVGGVFPLPWYNTKLEITGTRTENTLGERLSGQALHGITNGLDVALSRAWINTRQEQWIIRAGLDSRRHESYRDVIGLSVAVSDDDVRDAYISSSYIRRGDDYVMLLGGRVVRGLDILGAVKENDPGISNTNANPFAMRFEPTVYLNMLSPFSDGDFTFSATGQIASGELLSSQLFALGGYGSVRGFEPAAEAGEAGYAFTVEYQHPLPEFHERIEMTVGPFWDSGASYGRRNSPTDQHLHSVGLGSQIDVDIPKVGETSIRLDWARTIGSYNSANVNHDTVYFRIQKEL